MSAEKLENGKIRVHYKDTNGDNTTASEEFDTVLIATGRYPDTKALGCDVLGMKMDKGGKIIVNESEQTSIDNIFAIGDVASGKLELTPPAIKAG